MTFSEFDLSPRLTAGVDALGYIEPTPIQRKAIPPIQSGRDVMGLAQTGTGKTAAFALPILQRLDAQPRRGGVRALIIAPTRELAEQIHQSFVALGKQTRSRSMAIYGGVGIHPQIQTLSRGVEIVVACPGRLLDHMQQGNIDLRGVEVLVLDEADRMFDMGFLPDVRRIVRALPAQRQTLLFSATMPDDIRKLAGEVLSDPVTVQVDHAAPAKTVSHALYPVAQHLKTALLLELARVNPGSILVFTRTKHRAKRVAEILVRSGYEAAELQGNLSQSRRQDALDGFRTGKYRILVATDIAARGIDVAGISHVINYDMPDTTDAYTHRIGRTGRAEHTGEAFTFVTPEDALAVRDVERVLGYKLERRTVADFDYSVPAPQRDVEFARGPRPQQVRRKPAPAAATPPSSGARQSHNQRPDSAPAAAPAAAPSLPFTRTGNGPVRTKTTPRNSGSRAR